MEAAVDAIGEEDKKLAQLAGEIRSLCGETAETTSILRAASKMPKIDASGAFANAFTPEALKKSFEDAKKVRKSGGDPGPKCVNMELMIDHLSKNPDQAKNKKTKKLLEEASTFCISFGAIGSVRHHIAEAKAAREASKQASFSEHCVHAVEQLSKARQSASKEELTATVGTLCIEAVSLKDKFGHGPS
jgi:hypothetical protein